MAEQRPGILSRFVQRLGFVPAQQLREVERRAVQAQRSFLAALTGHDVAGWSSDTQHINVDTALGLKTVRARSRDAARNNEHAKRFLGMVRTNVLGPVGVRYQSRVTKGDGTLKDVVNARLERGFAAWGKKGVCDVTGRYTWQAVQRLVLETVARDGEALVRLVKGRGAHRFQVQLLDPGVLDVELNQDLGGGRRIRMGVEIDGEGAVLAYHLLADTTMETLSGVYARSRHTRVPTAEILHVFLPEEINQLRGTPWMATALKRLYMVQDFAQSGLNKARDSAKRGGFFTTPDGEPPVGMTQELKDGTNVSTVQDGTFETLPIGVTFTPYESQYPNIEYGQFIKDCLRSVASGLGTSYITLGNDLSEVNYSSARVGILDEREMWKALQAWLIEELHEPVFAAWLPYALLIAPELQGLSFDQIDAYVAAACWQPRRWAWVDPLKEIEANGRAIELLVTSPQRVIAERGDDPDEILAEIEQWRERTKGLQPAAGSTSPRTPEETEAADRRRLLLVSGAGKE